MITPTKSPTVADLTEFYIGVAGTSAIGAPSLLFWLTVDPQNHSVTGHAMIDWSSTGRTITIPRVSGRVFWTGLGRFTRVLAFEGDAFVTLPPPAIGTVVEPFSAGFSLEAGNKGTGYFKLGNSSFDDVSVSITVIPAK